MKPILRELRIFYYEVALSEISPLHADVPFIVMRLNDLKGQRP